MVLIRYQKAKQMTEYSLQQSEDVLTVRRTKSWFYTSLLGCLVLLTSNAFFLWKMAPPADVVSCVFSLVFFSGMLYVTYRLVFWARCLSFDRKNNLFSLDGRRVCALSDVTSVQMEMPPRQIQVPQSMRLQMLHVRTAQGKDIEIKYTREQSPDFRRLTDLAREITEFVGAPRANL